MTLTTTNNRKDYTGNGAITVFAYDFLIVGNADLGVYLDGVKKTLTTDYTVSGAGVPTGGNVTFVVAPASGVAVSIIREVAYTQSVDYVENQKFPAQTHEDALDRLTMLCQQLLEKIGRAATFATKSLLTNPLLPDGVVGKILRWKTTTELENIDLVGTGVIAVPVSAAQGGLGADLSAGGAIGDLLVADATTTFKRQGVGTTGQVLTADSAQASKVKWAAPGGSYNIRGLVGQNDSVTPNTKYGWSADAITVWNPTTGATKTFKNVATRTNDTGLAGPAANGRDQAAAFLASTWIHFYDIWDGAAANPVTISSMVAPPTGPTLPAGYTHWAYAGAVYYNATPLLVKTRMRGVWMFYEAGTLNTVVNAGAATTETNASTATFVPPNALMLSIFAIFSNTNAAVQNALIRYVTGVNTYALQAAATTGQDSAGGLIPNQNQNLAYLNGATGGSLTIYLLGYTVPNGGE